MGKHKGKKPLGGLMRRCEYIILRRIFRKLDVGACTGLTWLRIGTGEGQL